MIFEPLGTPVNPGTAMRNLQGAAIARTLAAVLAGIAVGVLGITGSLGWGVYSLQHAVASLALLQLARWRPADVWPQSSVFDVVVGAATEQALSFVLFWTLAFALVHIY